MTICNRYTHRAIPFTLDSYEFADRCRYTWRQAQDIDGEDAVARDCVSTDGAEVSFCIGSPTATAFCAGRELGFLDRVDALRASRAYVCDEHFMRGWQFAQRWGAKEAA